MFNLLRTVIDLLSKTYIHHFNNDKGLDNVFPHTIDQPWLISQCLNRLNRFGILTALTSESDLCCLNISCYKTTVCCAMRLIPIKTKILHNLDRYFETNMM